MGVCDGHGAHGHLISNFVKINLPKVLNQLIHGKKPEFNDSKKKSILPGRKSPLKELSVINEYDSVLGKDANLEFWLCNDNYKVRDYQIKEAFR